MWSWSNSWAYPKYFCNQFFFFLKKNCCVRNVQLSCLYVSWPWKYASMSIVVALLLHYRIWASIIKVSLFLLKGTQPTDIVMLCNKSWPRQPKVCGPYEATLHNWRPTIFSRIVYTTNMVVVGYPNQPQL